MDTSPGHTLHRIITLGKQFVLQTDNSRDAAAVLLSRYIIYVFTFTVLLHAVRVMTRPDVQGVKVTEFIKWCTDQLSSNDCMCSIIL